MAINKIVLFILFSLLTCATAQAATIAAESCSSAHVSTAISNASAGDTVTIPEGGCAWASRITIAAAITVQGAGSTSTIITNGGFTLGRSGARITAMGFAGTAEIVASGNNFRIDHCKFTRSPFGDSVRIQSTEAQVPDDLAGLIDNCEFINGRVLSSGTSAMFADDGGNVQHSLWAWAVGLGGSNSVYVEDNTFLIESASDNNIIDGNYGGSYVIRFNTITGPTKFESHSVQSNNRANRKWEIYKNTLSNTGDAFYYPYRIRGGTGVIFGNTMGGNWTNLAIAFDNIRSYDNVGDGGLCNGASTWDGNEDATGYPCRDQIGRGYDDPKWNHSPVGAYAQPLLPAYIFENRLTTTSALYGVNVINSSSDHIKPNRDYYQQGASFDGTSGVGVGLLSARPATCTAGVGYWATDQGTWNKTVGGDQGVLYKCTSTDTWDAYYTPYEYPHPLRGETARTSRTRHSVGGTRISIGGVEMVIEGE